jgi:spore coat polysaccharide biosynthesis protein SpsF
MNKVAIIVQARMGSTRLPGKVLKLIAGRPMFAYQLERLRRVRLAQAIVVATTTGVADDAIVQFCKDQGVECTRGSENDVLSRYCEAATKVEATVVVRVTSDCPLIDPELIDTAIATFQGEKHPDYVSNMLQPTWPYGMAVEVVSTAVLLEADRESRDAAEREHVTPFVYWRPQRYRLESLTMSPDLSRHRWTVDTPQDLELVTRILEALYPRKPAFTLADVLGVLEQHPDWSAINADVQQKTVVSARSTH